MKQSILILLLFFGTILLLAQVEEYDTYYFEKELEESEINQSRATIYKSSNGSDFPTKGVFRGLTIFVNIIYDQNDTISRYTAQGSVHWEQDITNSINKKIPTYLLSLFDTNVSASHAYNGCITRLYAEASFNELILLSDFMVVNIRQSQITPNNPRANFYYTTLMNAVIGYINQNGGLNSIYGHNSITDYDNVTGGIGKGLEKPFLPDSKIDFINFLTMNTIKNENVNYGDCNKWQGYSGVYPGTQIKIGNSYCGYNTGTYQCIGDEDITYYRRNILTHEFAHFFLGGNEFHTSGGTTNNDGFYNTFIGKQYGYGLFAGITACNAYERWRLGWRSPSNQSYPIAVNGINSDITAKFAGVKTFQLRDYVTYGDAIRIKLPYKDNVNSSNQYIWLVNHQMTKNNKMDFQIYSKANTCRNVDTDGIYAFYQVGKDVL